LEKRVLHQEVGFTAWCRICFFLSTPERGDRTVKRWTVFTSLLLLGAFGGAVATHSLLQGQPVAPPALPREISSYRDVVKQVLPAVVSIEARGKAAAPDRRRGLRDVDPTIPGETRKFLEDFRRQQFDGGLPRQGFGSGVVIDPRGVILTNNHVVEGADEVVVQFKDGRKIASKDIKADPKTDLAIVRVAMEGPLPFLKMGDSDLMEIGDRVLAVGAPFGLTGSVTHGIVSGKGRSLKMNMYEDFLQTDAAINPGNSGGPLINMAGEVIGINTAIKSRSGGFQGVGLAISSNLARDVMAKLLRDGVVKRGFLGIQIQDLNDPAIAQKLGLPKDQKGVVVTRAFDNGPAAKAGVQEGDVITTLGGRQVTDGREVQRIVADLPLGKPIKMTVLREGQLKSLDVTIEEQPADLGSALRPGSRSDE
jgi:serine protease Do